MKMITVETDQLIDSNKLDQLITESLRNLIPIQLSKRISSKKDRRNLLITYGENAFLIPKKLKFPVIDPDTGEFDCSLIYAARVRLRQYRETKKGYADLIDVADQLAFENNCEIKVLIQIQDDEESVTVDLLDMIEILI